MLWVVEPIPFREDFPGIHWPDCGTSRTSPRHLAGAGAASLVVEADAEAAPNDDAWTMLQFNWTTFQFMGNSILDLRNELARRVDAVSDIVMCVRAGCFARLTPMLVDLPRGGQGNTLYIIVVISGTPAGAALRFPDINA